MTRKPQARVAQTRERLIAAGRGIVAEAGLAGLRTEAVVARAETAKGTFFAHFPDRDHLLAVVLAEILQAALADLAPPACRDGLMTALDQIFTSFAAEPETVVLLTRFSGPVGGGLGLDRLICDLVARFAEGLGGMQHNGLIASVEDPAVLAEGLMAFVVYCAASAQCGAASEVAVARVRARAVLARMTEALLWPKA